MKGIFAGWVLAGLVCVPSVANAAPLTIDVSGIDSWNEQDHPENVVLDVMLAPFARVDGIGWDVTLQTFGESFLSDFFVEFGSTDQYFVKVQPAAGDPWNSPGRESFSSHGIVDLNTLPEGGPFQVGANGILRLQFWEVFDDVTAGSDGRWASGTITIRDDRPVDVPEPGTLGLLGAGLLGFAWRSRRRLT